jgi:hypothetical protein
MRTRVLSVLAIIVLASPGAAEDRGTTLPEIVIGGGEKALPVGSERCVEVEIGSSRALECLNQQLKRQVDRVNPSLNLPPLDAKSQDLKVGVVNVPGVQQQYGRNFGVSAFPYRPAPLIFNSPIGGPRR